MLAWVAWGAALAANPASAGTNTLSYLALCLTGCAGVAVLGARRPGVTAWNFVVAGLLAVLLLPLVQGFDTLHFIFLGAVLIVGLLNYVPTRFAPAVLLVGIGVATEFYSLTADEARVAALADALEAGRCLLAVSPWIALARSYRRRARSEFDRAWLAFRDRFGLFWGQRMRDQFNRSAANAEWPVQLHWRGLRRAGPEAPRELPPDQMKEILGTLRALLKRFEPEEHPVRD
jgi:hypothetical protein